MLSLEKFIEKQLSSRILEAFAFRIWDYFSEISESRFSTPYQNCCTLFFIQNLAYKICDSFSNSRLQKNINSGSSWVLIWKIKSVYTKFVFFSYEETYRSTEAQQHIQLEFSHLVQNISTIFTGLCCLIQRLFNRRRRQYKMCSGVGRMLATLVTRYVFGKYRN